MTLRNGLAASIALTLCACATPSEGNEQSDAVIVSPTEVSRASLRQAVTSMLSKPVSLADDALTTKSVLVIERAMARDPSGRKIEARDTAAPDMFRLVRRGSACVLIHENTTRESVLSDVKCEAVAR